MMPFYHCLLCPYEFCFRLMGPISKFTAYLTTFYKVFLFFFAAVCVVMFCYLSRGFPLPSVLPNLYCVSCCALHCTYAPSTYIQQLSCRIPSVLFRVTVAVAFEPSGTVRPLYRTGVSLLSRERFLYI